MTYLSSFEIFLIKCPQNIAYALKTLVAFITQYPAEHRITQGCVLRTFYHFSSIHN